MLFRSRQASEQILAESASADAAFRQLYGQWQAFRKEVFAWNRVNELSYATFSYGDAGAAQGAP